MDTYWNYRVVEDDDGFGIYEVYYHNDRPVSMTERPCVGPCETYEELLNDLEHIQRAVTEDTLQYFLNKFV